jgi:hypothetical protein
LCSFLFEYAAIINTKFCLIALVRTYTPVSKIIFNFPSAIASRGMTERVPQEKFHDSSFSRQTLYDIENIFGKMKLVRKI